jgi:hypothetical protein
MASPAPVKPTDNLQPMKLPDIGQPEQDQELQQLYSAVVAKTEEAIRWYDRHKSSHKRRAVALRTSAVVLAALASILPIGVSMLPAECSPQRWVPVASIFAALGAVCVAIDRLYGYSSNWMRYLVALLDLNQQLELLKFGWARSALETRITGGSKGDHLAASLNQLQATLASVNQTLKTETLEWVTHFAGALQELERSVTAQRAVVSTPLPLVVATEGAARVQLAGLETVEGHMCKLQLGEKAAVEHTGATKVFTGLTPGQYPLRVSAMRGGKAIHVEEVVTIKPGETASVSVSLA